MNIIYSALGLVKISDLLIIEPTIGIVAEDALESATDALERAESLRLEAETKLKTAAARKVEAQRYINAVKAFRAALGEKKGV